MKYILLLLFPLFLNAQCVKIDTVYSTAKLRELGNRDIRFGVKQIVEEEISNKYCISDYGEHLAIVKVEIFYFGIPKTTIRIVGIEQTNQITQVGVRLHVNGKKIEGYGESETEVRAIMIELIDGKVPFSKMTVSSALKRAIHEAVTNMSL
jgi:hypothetical protein